MTTSKRIARHKIARIEPLLAIAVVLLTACLLTPGSAAAKSLVPGRLDQLAASGEISQATHDEAINTYAQARILRKQLTGDRRAALNYTISVAERLAHTDRLTVDRIDPVMLIIKRNTEWFKNNGPAAYGARQRFGTSRIIFQYFPGCGWQIHPLANFSRLNAVWTDKSAKARRSLRAYANELINLSVPRGGFTAWEYYFNFGGGSPPWISSIAQGTAIQSLSRTANALKDPGISAVVGSSLAAFSTDAPLGLRVDSSGGNHYLIYSFNKDLLVLNAFIQSLIGLHDTAELTGNPVAQQLFDAGEVAARVETPLHDTGAWSLYALHGNESDLSYHLLLRDFLGGLCERTTIDAYCKARDNFTVDTTTAPEISKLAAAIKNGRVAVRFNLSKISRVTVSLYKNGVSVGGTSTNIGYGPRRFTFNTTRKSGTYTLRVEATDLASNWRKTEMKIKVKKSKKKHQAKKSHKSESV